MSTQMMIRMDPGLKARLSRFAQAEGKSASQVVRELVEEYVRERDPAAYIDDLWERIGRRLTADGHSAGELEQVIAEVRRRP